MPEPLSRARVDLRRPGVAALATALAALLLLAGALIWFRPFLTRVTQPIASIPSPRAIYAPTAFVVAPHEQACMSSVALEPDARLAMFEPVPPTTPTPSSPPALELVLSAASYRSATTIPRRPQGDEVALPIAPPPRSLIGTACFVNRGGSSASLAGTVEARTLSRSGMTIGGQPVVGDIALTFLGSHPRSLLGRLGEAFRHASNLTDGLLPVWLIWLLAMLVALGVPLATLGAFYLAMREDTVAGRL